MIYQQRYLENPTNQILESSYEDDNQRYVKILESENQLLKEKVQILEEKLKNYEELEKESQTIAPKKRKTQK